MIMVSEFLKITYILTTKLFIQKLHWLEAGVLIVVNKNYLGMTKNHISSEEVMNKEDKKLLLELICNEQVHMIVKDNTKYESDKYKKLEELKVKIKDI